jgi:hypothetical protein
MIIMTASGYRRPVVKFGSAMIRWNLKFRQELFLQQENTTMKRILISAAIFATALSSTANAKGCIKGAIVGGLAGHMAGHGKVGAAAGCVIGHHEANKADAEKMNSTRPKSQSKDDGKL